MTRKGESIESSQNYNDHICVQLSIVMTSNCNHNIAINPSRQGGSVKDCTCTNCVLKSSLLLNIWGCDPISTEI